LLSEWGNRFEEYFEVLPEGEKMAEAELVRLLKQSRVDAVLE
jgi:hypothetical protein